ncbi:methanogen output domain 1-containing protein [Bacillus sp. m3-13]|uniref:methanogen output domain 1-containing protein n=1 Tax=Bacillus sp. m3-13 TaxID=406124 RepID=UPI0001E89521|nr:methanogen output domain 1-containing protein [Bacillus sp. m3-13]
MSTKTRLTGSIFLSKLITQYAFIHEKTVGETAGEYIRQIGLRTGEWIEDFYGNREDDWSVNKYAEVIVELKNSIGGEFYVSSITPEYVIVKANRCPFGEMVKDAPHLCNMTSSVFGGIASRKFGYGKVDLKKRIAIGDLGCEVVIYFKANEFSNGDVYENLPRTPENVDPFQWKNETIVLLNEELLKSDELVVKLLDELESLKKQVQMGRN